LEAERLLVQPGLMLQGSRSVVARTQYPSRTLTLKRNSPNKSQTRERVALETRIIDSRKDPALWAIDRSNAILTDQGSELATAARTGNEAQIGETARALGQAIVDVVIEAFDGLNSDEKGPRGSHHWLCQRKCSAPATPSSPYI